MPYHGRNRIILGNRRRVVGIPVLPPPVPSNVQSWAMDGSTLVQWQANRSFGDVWPASYNVYRGGSLLASGVYTPYYRDTSVTNGTAYTYTVTAVSLAGAESAHSSSAGCTPTATTTVLSDTWAGGGAGAGGVDSTKWNQGTNTAGYSISGNKITLAGNSNWTTTYLAGVTGCSRGTGITYWEIPITCNTLGYIALGWSDTPTPTSLSNLWHALFNLSDGELLCRDNLNVSTEQAQETVSPIFRPGDSATVQIWMLQNGGAYWRLKTSSRDPGAPRPLCYGRGNTTATMYPCILAHSGSYTIGPVDVKQTPPPPLKPVLYNGNTTPSGAYGSGVSYEELGIPGQLGVDLQNPYIIGADSPFTWNTGKAKDPERILDPATGRHWAFLMTDPGAVAKLGMAVSTDGQRFSWDYRGALIDPTTLGQTWGAGAADFPRVRYDWEDSTNPVKLWWCAGDATFHGTLGYIKAASFQTLRSAVASAVNTIGGNPVLGQPSTIASGGGTTSGNIGPVSRPHRDPATGNYWALIHNQAERGWAWSHSSTLEGAYTVGSNAYTSHKLRYQITSAITAGATTVLTVAAAGLFDDSVTGNPVTDSAPFDATNGYRWFIVNIVDGHFEEVLVKAISATQLTLMSPVANSFSGTVNNFIMPVDYFSTPSSFEIESASNIILRATGWHQCGADGVNAIETQFYLGASALGGSFTVLPGGLNLPGSAVAASSWCRDSSENPNAAVRTDSNHSYYMIPLGGPLLSVKDNLTAWYDNESTAWADASGNLGALTAHGTVAAVAGKVGNGAQGSAGGYLTTPNVIIGGANADGHSVFLYECAQTATAEVIWSIGSGTTGVYLTQNGGSVTLTINNGTDGPVTSTAINSMVAGHWYVVEINWNAPDGLNQIGLLVYDMSNASLGVGNYHSIDLPAHGMPAVTAPVSLLAKWDGTSPATGIIDSVGIWVGASGRDGYFPETQTLFNGGAGRNYAGLAGL